MDDHDTFFHMMQVQNMNCISMFYKHVSVALRDVLKDIENWGELDEGKRNWWTREFEIHYPDKLRQTAFLLMFGHLEEMLILMTKSFNPRRVDLAPRGYGLSRYKPYIRDILGPEFSTNRDYQHILQAQTVRNTILHIAGRVSLSKDSEHLKVLASRDDHYEIKKDRIGVTLNGLAAMQKATLRLLETLLKKSRLGDASKAGAPA